MEKFIFLILNITTDLPKINITISLMKQQYNNITLCYHNSSGAEITSNMGEMKKHLENQFLVTLSNRHMFCVLMMLVYHA